MPTYFVSKLKLAETSGMVNESTTPIPDSVTVHSKNALTSKEAFQKAAKHINESYHLTLKQAAVKKLNEDYEPKRRITKRAFMGMFKGSIIVLPQNKLSLVNWTTPTYYVADTAGHGFDVWQHGDVAIISGRTALNLGKLADAGIIEKYTEQMRAPEIFQADMEHGTEGNDLRWKILDQFVEEVMAQA